MRFGEQESRYIHKLDSSQISPEQAKKQGKAGEEMVMELFRSIPGVEVRPATKEEDSGYRENEVIRSGSKMVDAVVYRREREGKKEKLIPLMGIQVTIASSRESLVKKLQEMKEMPFMRLKEMGRNDVPIPRVTMLVDPAEAVSFVKDRDLNKHSKAVLKMYEDARKSLEFDLLQTRNLKEQEHAKYTLALVESQIKILEEKNKSEPS